jgi:hypothetical protein
MAAENPSETQERVPHQLLVHVDEHANGDIDIRYCYPFSEPHPLPEQVVRLPSNAVPERLRSDLSMLRTLLRDRIRSEPVRIPHGEITPVIQDGILTVVTRDQRRDLPVARLYLYEVAEALASRRERQSRMEGKEFTDDQRRIWKQIAQAANGIAWSDFQSKIPSK